MISLNAASAGATISLEQHCAVLTVRLPRTLLKGEDLGELGNLIDLSTVEALCVSSVVTMAGDPGCGFDAQYLRLVAAALDKVIVTRSARLPMEVALCNDGMLESFSCAPRLDASLLPAWCRPDARAVRRNGSAVVGMAA